MIYSINNQNNHYLHNIQLNTLYMYSIPGTHCMHLQTSKYTTQFLSLTTLCDGQRAKK